MFSRLSTRRVLYRRPFVDKRRSPNALVTSPYTTTSASPRTSGSILKQAATAVTVLVGGSLFAVYYFDSRSAIHRYFFTPLIRNVLDPEVAHKVAVKVLKSGLAPRDMGVDDERLSTEVSLNLVLIANSSHFNHKLIYSFGKKNFQIRLVWQPVSIRTVKLLMVRKRTTVHIGS